MQKLVLFLSFCSLVFSQSLEPRLYSNAPTDMSFLVLGYAHTQGALSNIPNLGLKDADLGVNIGILAYAHYLNIGGDSAKFDIIVPLVNINGTGSLLNSSSGLYEDVSRNVSGLGDIKARLSYNFYGAPALGLKDFATYKQDTIVGVSLQVTMPTGQYDSSKLVNVSPHRWAIKSGIGISKTINDFIVELSADAEFYSQNDEFLGSNKRQQAVVYSTQVHVIYNFMRGLWLGMDANYYVGGENTTNGIKADDSLANARYGMTLSVPLNRYNSIKLYGNSGIVTRTGTDFDMLGVMWQIRFND